MNYRSWLTVVALFGLVSILNAGSLFTKKIKIDRAMSPEAESCISCHAERQPGIINDWIDSRHGHVGVSCLDCHQQTKDSPMASQCDGIKGKNIYISAVVTPKTCGRCHPVEVEQFMKSGHARASIQYMGTPKEKEVMGLVAKPKKGILDLMFAEEGKNHPEFKNAPNENGCMQCHGTELKLDMAGKPLSSTWPNTGIGSVWPDGSIGSCTPCHTRHKFSIAEARKPEACASCHLGPDHPQIEIYESSKHGQIYATEGDEWEWNSAPGAWEPGDYRAPTCATCHMSGIGALKTTHDVSRRLHWNLWGKMSKKRGGESGEITNPTNPLVGNAKRGRAEMKDVCSNCHSKLFADNYFEQFDRQVHLYNDEYYKPALKMLNDLKAKNLLLPKTEKWADEFQEIFYHLWHHEGRIMRMGASMGSADYAHWHGSFKVMIDLAKLKRIYEHRIKTSKID